MSTLPYVWIYEFAHQFHVVGTVFNRRFPVDFHHLEKETIKNIKFPLLLFANFLLRRCVYINRSIPYLTFGNVYKVFRHVHKEELRVYLVFEVFFKFCDIGDPGHQHCL